MKWEFVSHSMTNNDYKKLKEQLDFIGASLLIILLSPIFLLLIAAITLDSRGSAVYRQKRVGRKGRLFTIYKFRSMRRDAPLLSTEEMQRQNERPFTRLGPLLRKTNLDELPQLFNILKGDMSFIGPRPALPSQVDVNTRRDELGADEVRPGITGLAQVKGRDDLDTETKTNYDADYCRRLSLKLDAQILLRTFGAVFSGRGNK